MADEPAPLISIVPVMYPQIAEAVRAAGALRAPPSAADAVVWTDPSDPEHLGSILIDSPARWVQLPFAGVDAFAAAGLLDPSRIWTSAGGIYGAMVAEHALALMLAAARSLQGYARLTTWTEQGDLPVKRMQGQKVLLVGTGGIGRALARMLEPLEPTVLAVNRSGTPMVGASATYDASHLVELVGQVDWVVLAAPLTAETRHLFDASMFAAMSRQAWLVNVARGELVVTDDLVAALSSRAIAGAALDVTDPEPLPDGHPLWSMPNVLLTPHTANTWEMALPELAARVERNIIAFMNGQPLEGVVDPERGY